MLEIAESPYKQGLIHFRSDSNLKELITLLAERPMNLLVDDD